MKTNRTKIFAYKGFIGIKSFLTAPGLINDPRKPGQLGFVIDARFVDVSPEALKLLKKIPKSGDDIGDVDVFKSEKFPVVISWLGGCLKMLKPGDGSSGSINYDPSLITPCKGVEIDPTFITAVDVCLEKEGKTK